MKKEIITILTFIVLIMGVVLIYTLLNPSFNSDKNEDKYSEFDEKNYIIRSEHNNLIEYELNDLALLDVYIENFNILYKNKTLKINDKLISNNVFLFKRCALYSKSKLVLFINYLDKEYGAYVIYNTLDDTFEIIDMIDNMYVIINENIYFESIGFTLNISSVNSNKFIKNNNLICNINDNRIVQKYIEVYYDQNSLKFDRMEDLSSLGLDGYKKNNGYC